MTTVIPGKTIVVGLDLSLSATGVAMISVGKAGHRLLRTAVCSAPDPDKSEMEKGLRLHELTEAIVGVLRQRPGIGPYDDVYFFAEGYSFGSPFAARRIGETHGAVFARIWNSFRHPIAYVSPAAAKLVACPNHYGWSKEKWAAAKKAGKWKRSMPSKEEVMRGVFDQFGLSLGTDAEADAFCVAVAGLKKHHGFDLTGRKLTDARW